MGHLEQIKQLNRMLLAEMPQYRKQAEAFPPDEVSQRQLLRSLMNVRPPVPASEEFLCVQDAYLSQRLAERGVTRLTDLTPVRPGLYLWRGDITTLAADAIVNAANSRMLGCFVPCHGCIDNAIHTYAGVQLRMACAELMGRQVHEEEAGRAKITRAMCYTPSARSSVAASPKQTGNNWRAVTAPAWSWRRSAASTVWPSAVSPPGSSISPTSWPRRSPFRRSVSGNGTIQTKSR